jgi:2'-hydroxyisoflavone reductase
MRLLVLGGTRFVGRAVARAGLGHGWEVAAFNRGLSAPDVPGVYTLRGDRTKAADLARLAAAGPWDAVVDTSGYVPRDVLAACKLPRASDRSLRLHVDGERLQRLAR